MDLDVSPRIFAFDFCYFSIDLQIVTLALYPGSQAPFWEEEVTSPAIVGLNTILVRLCHPIEGLGGLLTDFFGAMVKLHIVSCYLSCLRITNVF